MPLNENDPKPERAPTSQQAGSLVEQGLDFVRALHTRSPPTQGHVPDQAFIDELYGEP
jgi:hypothetical protein